MKNKIYIGDSVYAEMNNANQLVLTTNNGYSDDNTIYLEPEVWNALLIFMEAPKERGDTP